MKRVFISCPIKGKQYKEVLEMRRAAQEKLQQRFPDEEIVIIDSFIPAMYFDKNNNPITGLGTCITLMGNADLVYICKGWEESRGCNIERRVAICYEIPIIYELDNK